MKTKDLKTLTLEELIVRFREHSAKHGQLLNALNTRAANKEYRHAAAVRKELRTRRPDAEKYLLELLTDPEPGTRYWAATAALGFAPSEAERALALLAEPPPTLLGVSASMTLRAWEDGTLPPQE